MGDTDTQTMSPDTGADLGAIIGGMQQSPALDRTRAPLPDPLQPGYQTPLPNALQLQPPPGQRDILQPSPPLQPQPPAPTPAQPPSQPAPQPQTVAANQPMAPPPQRNVPWPAANPDSPVFQSASAMPPLPGETPQETAALNGHSWHETNGRSIINDDAAKNPALYTDKDNPRTCQGYWQTVNSTWRDGATRAGVDLGRYPTALAADYWTQRKVALALYRAYGDAPWKAQPGAGEQGDRFHLRPQLPLPPEQRDQKDWGSPPPRDFGPEPTGRPFGQAAFMEPGQSGFTRVLNAVGPLLMGIGSLALHLPLSTAITAYGAMAKAQDNGQREAYERARTQFQDQLKEANAQQTLESQAASDAFAEYANNPEGLQQELARIGLQYNDPTMYRMAEKGDLNGIHQMQSKRDQYNQDLTKLNKANEDAEDRRAQDAAVQGLDQQWHDDFVKTNGREPTAAETAIAHNENIGKAARAGTKDPKAATTGEGLKVYNIVDKDGKPTGKQVRLGKDNGLYNLDGSPYTLAPGEKLGDEAGTKASAASGKDPTESDYTWTNPDGSAGEGLAKIKNNQLVDAVTEEPIPTKAGTRVNKISAASAQQAGVAAHGAPGKIEDWDGMKDGLPPPDKGITNEAWTQAQDWARMGRAPVGLSSRSGAYQSAYQALPYALHALGKTGADMPRDAIEYQTEQTASTATERYFASGMGARQLTALDTVAAHIKLFGEYADAMKAHNNTAINRVLDDLATLNGDPTLIDMGIASTITGDEVIRLLTQTGGTRGDREDIKNKLSVYSSPDQFKGIADTLTNFVRERYDPLKQQYTNRLGATPADKARYEEAFQNKITPTARSILGEKRPIAGSDVPTMTEQQYNAAPSGTHYRIPGDNTVRVKP